ncbi:hypothetical protein GGP91_002831 [Salinibacter ruber]|nr:hypothetical protein [Salinibacter ruber]MCS3830738.1 hypothetical protein [Salinibacter ruber]MCS4057916.1 hypothetical protein [Salinibacter ruber]MCS4162864.1 hypothetical protein [Salinibacter ruber]
MMFEKEHFPYEYHCERCGASAAVTHEDVQYVPSYLASRSATDAAEYVISRRGWALESMEGILCSECINGAFSE